MRFFKITPKRGRSKQLKGKETANMSKSFLNRSSSNNSSLNETISLFKSSILKKRTAQSQPRPTGALPTSYSILINDQDEASELNGPPKNATVRARSQLQKAKQLHKDTVEFNRRILAMNKKRN